VILNSYSPTVILAQQVLVQLQHPKLVVVFSRFLLGVTICPHVQKFFEDVRQGWVGRFTLRYDNVPVCLSSDVLAEACPSPVFKKPFYVRFVPALSFPDARQVFIHCPFMPLYRVPPPPFFLSPPTISPSPTEGGLSCSSFVISSWARFGFRALSVMHESVCWPPPVGFFFPYV